MMPPMTNRRDQPDLARRTALRGSAREWASRHEPERLAVEPCGEPTIRDLLEEVQNSRIEILEAVASDGRWKALTHQAMGVLEKLNDECVGLLDQVQALKSVRANDAHTDREPVTAEELAEAFREAYQEVFGYNPVTYSVVKLSKGILSRLNLTRPKCSCQQNSGGNGGDGGAGLVVLPPEGVR